MAEKTPITVCVPAGPGTGDFTDFVVDTALRCAARPDAIAFIVALPDYVDPAEFEAVSARPNVTRITVPLEDLAKVHSFNSLAHCRALGAMLKRIETPIGMFVDCDAAFVRHGWDLELPALLDDQIKMVGTAYPSAPTEATLIDPAHAGRAIYKFQNFPNVVGCLFDATALGGTNLNFGALEKQVLANGGKPVFIDDEDLKIAANIPEGAIWYCDTGFEVPILFHKRGWQTIALEMVPSGAGAVLTEKLEKILREGERFPGVSEEYQLHGVPYLVHFGKASRRDSNSDEANKWRQAVENWIRDHDPVLSAGDDRA